MPIMQGIVYPNALPVNGDLQTYQVSGGAINAGEFVQFSDTVSLGTRTQIVDYTRGSLCTAVKLNETDVLALNENCAVVARFTESGTITTGPQVTLTSDSNTEITDAILLDTNTVLVSFLYGGNSYSSSAPTQSGSQVMLLTINGLQITTYPIQNASMINTSDIDNEPNPAVVVSLIPVSETCALVTLSYPYALSSHLVYHRINVVQCNNSSINVGESILYDEDLPNTNVSCWRIYGAPIGNNQIIISSGTARIATISGSTISFSEAQEIEGSFSFFRVFQPFISNDYGLFLANSEHDTDASYIWCAPFYLSGNTLNIGTASQLTTETYSGKYQDIDCYFISPMQAVVSCAGSACVVEIGEDLSLTSGTWTQVLPSSSSGHSFLNNQRMVALKSGTMLFIGDNANPCVVSGMSITLGDNTALAATADFGVFLDSLNIVAAFDGSLGDVYATPISMLVMPYETVAFGVAKTDGAVGDTITIYLPPSS